MKTNTVRKAVRIHLASYIHALTTLNLDAHLAVGSAHEKNDKVIVLFKITREGKLMPGSLKVQSASTPQAQRNAIQAINLAAPYFRPLPNGAPNFVTIDFTFTETRQRR